MNLSIGPPIFSSGSRQRFYNADLKYGNCQSAWRQTFRKSLKWLFLFSSANSLTKSERINPVITCYYSGRFW